MFTAGTETTSTTTIWAMAEMMKNPSIFAKAQEEVREAFRDKVKFDKYDFVTKKIVFKDIELIM